MSDDDLSEDIPLADLAATARVQRDIKRDEARIEEMAKRRRLAEPPVPAAASTAEQVWAFLSGATSSGAGVDVVADTMSATDQVAYHAKLKQLNRSGSAAARFATSTSASDVIIEHRWQGSGETRRTMQLPGNFVAMLNRVSQRDVPIELQQLLFKMSRGDTDNISFYTGTRYVSFNVSKPLFSSEKRVYMYTPDPA
jgi:hypothetical protein